MFWFCLQANQSCHFDINLSTSCSLLELSVTVFNRIRDAAVIAPQLCMALIPGRRFVGNGTYLQLGLQPQTFLYAD